MLFPPPVLGMISTSRPAWRRKAAIPSGRLNGPEKRRCTARNVCADSPVSGTSQGISWICGDVSAGGAALGSPGGWSTPVSAGMAATGSVCVGETGFHGRSQAVSEVYADPSAWLHARFAVGNAGHNRESAAPERKYAYDARFGAGE
eukprot:6197989-Pleurochrysis_carterae.AAC.2